MTAYMYESYGTDPALATAWRLQLSGQWDLALEALASLEPQDAQAAAALRAQILVDRYTWRLDHREEAVRAISALDRSDPRLGGYLAAHLAYWRLALGSGRRADGAAVIAAFGAAAQDPRMAAWAGFHHAVAIQYLAGDLETASAGFAAALAAARETGDLFLESYALRHQAEIAPPGDRERTVSRLQRSLQLRTALGARPHCAAAQEALAGALGESPEAAELRELAARTAVELRLSWLRSLLSGQPPSEPVPSGT